MQLALEQKEAIWLAEVPSKKVVHVDKKALDAKLGIDGEISIRANNTLLKCILGDNVPVRVRNGSEGFRNGIR